MSECRKPNPDFCDGNGQDLATVKLVGFQRSQDWYDKVVNVHLDHHNAMFNQLIGIAEDTRKVNHQAELNSVQATHFANLGFLNGQGHGLNSLLTTSKQLDEANLRRSGYNDSQQNRQADNTQKQVRDNDDANKFTEMQSLDFQAAVKKQILDNDDFKAYFSKLMADGQSVQDAFRTAMVKFLMDSPAANT